MMHKLTATLALLIGTLFAGDIYALGLSHIQVFSKLNEPLNAKVNVLSIPKGSIASLRVDLASASAFSRAGIERPYVLTAIRFTVEPVGKTDAVIRLTTVQPLKEPFLNFLVEVTWPSGRILREYTILLDPPLYKKTPPTVTARTSTSTKTPSPRTTSRRQASSSTRGKGRTTSSRSTRSTGGSSYTVNPSDTLWKIALQTQPSGKNAHQHMINIYNANPHAFIRNDMNLIKAGAKLRIPEWSGETQPQISSPINREEPDTQQNTGVIVPSSPPASTLVNESGEPTGQVIVREPEPESPPLQERTTGVGSRPSAAADTSSEEVVGLQKQLTQLTEKNVSIEAENKDLKTQLSETKKLATDTKKEVDNLIKAQSDLLAKLQELGDLQTKLAQLQTQLKTKDKENEELKKQLAEAKALVEKQASAKKETQTPDRQIIAQLDEKTEQPKSVTEKPQLVEEKTRATQPMGEETQPVQPTGEETQPAQPTGEETQPVQPTGEETKPIQLTGETKPAQPIGEELEPSFVDTVNDLVNQIPGGWMTVGGVGGGTLLLFLVGGFLRKQRGNKSTEPVEWKQGTQLTDEEIQEELARLNSEAQIIGDMESIELESDTESEVDKLLKQIQQETEPSKAESDFDQVDPAFDKELHEEVDVYMAYERYDQAENLIKSAIEQYPHHPEYRLKLLEVYAAANEADKFEEQARLLHDSVGGEGVLWEKTQGLWQDLATGRELVVTSPKADKGISGAAAAAGIAGGVAVGAIAAASLGENEEESTATELAEESFDESSLGDENGLDFNIEETFSEEQTDYDESVPDETSLLDMDEEESYSLGETSDYESEQNESTLLDLGEDEDSYSLAETESLDLGETESLDLGEDDSDLSLGLDTDIEGMDSVLDLGEGDDLSTDDDLELSLDSSEEIDSDLGDNTSLSLDITDEDSLSLDSDLDLSLDEETSSGTSDEEDLSLGDDFDLEETTGNDDNDLSLESDLESDLDLSLEEEPSATTNEIEEDLSLEDDLDLSLEEEPTAASEVEEDLSLEDDLGLSLEEEPAATSEVEEDLSLEDDLGLSLEEEPTAAEVEEDLSLEDDLDLSLEEEPTAASEVEEDLSLEDDLGFSLEEGELTAVASEVEEDDNSADLEINEEDLSFSEGDLPGDLPGTEENELDLNAIELDEELTSELENIATDNSNTGETDLDSTDDLESLLSSFGDQDLEDDTGFDSADEISGQFDLAKMFIDMDDNESALGILEEISAKGNDEQKRKAKELMEEIA